MPDPPADKVLFYPVWVSSSGRRALCWGQPCEVAGDARRIGKVRVDAKEASLAFVVRFGDGEKLPLINFVYPEAAQKIIRHWEALYAATETPDDDH